jgi:hypothetical protein
MRKETQLGLIHKQTVILLGFANLERKKKEKKNIFAGNKKTQNLQKLFKNEKLNHLGPPHSLHSSMRSDQLCFLYIANQNNRHNHIDSFFCSILKVFFF